MGSLTNHFNPQLPTYPHQIYHYSLTILCVCLYVTYFRPDQVSHTPRINVSKCHTNSLNIILLTAGLPTCLDISMPYLNYLAMKWGGKGFL